VLHACRTPVGRSRFFAHLPSRRLRGRDANFTVSIEQFELLSLRLGIGGLVLYMVYIMYRLAQESGAGRFGTLMIFLSLGLGIIGFALKSVIQLVVQV